MRIFSESIFIALCIFASVALGADLDGLRPEYIDFLKAETSNSYIASDSTVDAKYRADGIKPFKVGYLKIPAAELNLEVSTVSSQILAEHFFIEGSQQKQIRFFIHPDSEHLYKPLIEKYGYKGYYNAVATASTRTVLSWDPARPDTKPLFLKLSLAQVQDRLGRIIPGWEGRRSIQITEAANQDIKENKSNPRKVALIPEVAGAYVKADQGMKFYIDATQGQVAEHGFILRDASFIEENKGKKIVPMFWLFSKGTGIEPPIIQLWKKSRYFTNKPNQQNISFNHFVVEFLFKPFIHQNLPLMLFQGIVPQIHGQNVVLVLDPETLKIEKILHRDVGSMKSDYRLRWLNGLKTDSLRSELADKDFGLSWGAEQIEKYHISYLHDWLLQWGYLKDIRSVLPTYDPSATRQLVYQALKEEIAKQLNSPHKDKSPTDQITEFVNSKKPDLNSARINLEGDMLSSEEMRVELLKRTALQQVVSLPHGWREEIEIKFKNDLAQKGYVVTSYGIIFRSPFIGGQEEDLKIAFYENKNIFMKAVSNEFKMCQSLF